MAEPTARASDNSPTLLGLADFARDLRKGNRTVEETVQQILALSIELIGNVHHGCVTTLEKGKRTVVASTDSVAEEMCRLQYELDEGPIDNELQHLDTVVSGELDGEQRWPQFAKIAVAEGVRSLAAFRLYSGDGDLGALVFYSKSTDAFDEDDLIVGEAVATHAALALLAARERDQLKSALARRDIIGQAKGMLMERYSIDALRAFDLLVKLSQERNQRLHDVAAELVAVESVSQ
ncbi:hypothetical protein CH289_06110 [Rhodococcus sp. RS1C4]|uniref:GAF and ANTAR domain-containing protein n=1 Tax=Nocardiaceae TaxID=85025 RepID=UPI000361F41D|nr:MULTISPECIES: GAF and ANTAR domain-containing protein [Rhodococcus]OZC56292.1 hypothetical protein CH289_06110 [Rhodococcus sp. RS1C4]OZC60347.1 hypothetical protein CH267_05230 [Rhodococcus sp. 06-621-2]OZC78383.1 hypothetical protein CH282_21695 [Rhodococcus sp. 06-418-1B]OZD17732.1 hypothetical protein CH280_07855 [Rhodococcus sp. 06-156-4C]OZD21467.1 hypothetical protein CH248_10165 [Rhodococcus sp. 06-156-4a]